MNSRLSFQDGSAPSATMAAVLTTPPCADDPRRHPRAQMNAALRRLDQFKHFLRDLAAQDEGWRRDVKEVAKEVLAIQADLQANDDIGVSTSARRRRLRASVKRLGLLEDVWRVAREFLHDQRLMRRHGHAAKTKHDANGEWNLSDAFSDLDDEGVPRGPRCGLPFVGRIEANSAKYPQYAEWSEEFCLKHFGHLVPGKLNFSALIEEEMLRCERDFFNAVTGRRYNRTDVFRALPGLNLSTGLGGQGISVVV